MTFVPQIVDEKNFGKNVMKSLKKEVKELKAKQLVIIQNINILEKFIAKKMDNVIGEQLVEEENFGNVHYIRKKV